MIRRRTLLLPTLALSCASVVLAACGGGGGTSGTSAPSAGAAALEGTGPITLVQGKDTSGFVKQLLDGWNKANPSQQVRLIELPDSADAQRQQFIQNAQTKSDAYDVISVDNVWVAEFAANRYILPLPKDQFALDKMLPPVLQTAYYFNSLYAVPGTSDGGLLYYRKDLLTGAGVTAPPKTWAEMIEDCKKVKTTPAGASVGCYAGQFNKYEGLTVNFAEAVNGAGGVITDENGKPNVDTPQAKAGLDFLVNGFQQGYIPKEAITYKEEEGRRAFQEGKLVFHRQWPYAYSKFAATDGSSAVAGKFDIAPLPGDKGLGVSSLGGHNWGISTYSKKKKTALDFVKYYTSEAESKQSALLSSNAPVYTAQYSDPQLTAKYPYLPTLLKSIQTAKPRPKVVRYGDATTAIQDAAYGALQGTTTSAVALKTLQSKLEELAK